MKGKATKLASEQSSNFQRQFTLTIHTVQALNKLACDQKNNIL